MEGRTCSAWTCSEHLRWGTRREEQVEREIEISALNSRPRDNFKKAAGCMSLELKRDVKAGEISVSR